MIVCLVLYFCYLHYLTALRVDVQIGTAAGSICMLY